jgi:hypothetical protein
MVRAALMIMLAAFVPLAAAAAPDGQFCTFERAHYRTPQMTLSFVGIGGHEDMVSDLAMHVRDRRTGRDIGWYYFDQGSAPRISLISTTDPTVRGWKHDPDDGERPHGSATFLGMNADGSLLQSPPSSRSRATQFVIIPELGEVLKGERWGQADGNGIQASGNDGFVLTGCDD